MSTNNDKGSTENPPRKNRAFVCDYRHCETKRTFRSKDELRVHVSTHGFYLCPGCDKSDTQEKLETHFMVKRHIRKQSCYAIEAASIVASDVYFCDLCDYKNTEINVAVDHYWSHSYSRDVSSKSKKKKKKKKVVQRKKAVSGTAGQSTSIGKAHVRRESTSSVQNPPEESPASEESRVTGQSTRVVLFPCGFNRCTEKFSCIQTFRKHLLSHGVRNEVCPICACEFNTKMLLDKHFEVHVKKVHFSGKMQHMGESSVENLHYYGCPLCRYTSLQIGTVVKHYWKEHVVASKFKNGRKPVSGNSDPAGSERHSDSGDSCDSSDESIICTTDPYAVPNSVGREEPATEDSNVFVSEERKVARNEKANSGTAEVQTATTVCGETNLSPTLNNNGTYYKRNIRARRSKRIKIHVCPACACEFITKQMMETHFKVHTRKVVRKLRLKDGSTTEEYDYGCELCYYSSVRLYLMIKHYMNVHEPFNHSKKKRMLGTVEDSSLGASESQMHSSDSCEEATIRLAAPTLQTSEDSGNMEFEFVSVPNSVEEVENLEELEDQATDPLGDTNVGSGAKNLGCDSSGVKADNRRAVSTHVRIHTKTGDRFFCRMCDFQAKTAAALREHTFMRHTQYSRPGEKALKMCPHCSYKCCKDKTLKAHMNAFHPAKKPNSKPKTSACEICGAKFDASQMLKKHLATGRGDFVCGICDYKCNYKCGLDTHKKTHNIEVFSCSLCKFVGISAASLIMHKKHKH